MSYSCKNSNRAVRLGTKAKHYRARIKRFLAALRPNSVAIVVSNPERTRSNDTHYAFRQSSDVLYLNGFDEPNSALVFAKIGNKPGKLIMFVPANDALREQWTGIRAGVEGAKAGYLADEAYTNDQFFAVVGKMIDDAEHVYYRPGNNEFFDKSVTRLLSSVSRCLHNPEDITHEMRMFKSKEEVRLMQEAARISAQAHVAAAKRCRPGLMEYNLQATMECVFMDNGAMSPAYTSIVANGGNGWVLHYVKNNAELKDGDMVLIDAACEYQGYAADITRTFPVNGKFSPAQREIYQLVLDAQLAAIQAAKPGVTLADIHEVAADVLRRGLVRLGLLEANMKTAKGERWLVEHMRNGRVKKMPVLSTYYPHGTGHFLGLDVHDVSSDGKRSASAKKRPLEPGMVFTVEPGLYFAADDLNVPCEYRGIAVRIEDDVIITENGNSVLTFAVPKEIDAIEKLMARGSRLQA